MRSVYGLRERYAVPAIASLVLAVLLTQPLSLPVFHLEPMEQAVAHLLLKAAIWLAAFLPAQWLWARWLARRAQIASIDGGVRDWNALRELDRTPGA